MPAHEMLPPDQQAKVEQALTEAGLDAGAVFDALKGAGFEIVSGGPGGEMPGLEDEMPGGEMPGDEMPPPMEGGPPEEPPDVRKMPLKEARGFAVEIALGGKKKGKDKDKGPKEDEEAAK